MALPTWPRMMAAPEFPQMQDRGVFPVDTPSKPMRPAAQMHDGHIVHQIEMLRCMLAKTEQQNQVLLAQQNDMVNGVLHREQQAMNAWTNPRRNPHPPDLIAAICLGRPSEGLIPIPSSASEDNPLGCESLLGFMATSDQGTARALSRGQKRFDGGRLAGICFKSAESMAWERQ